MLESATPTETEKIVQAQAKEIEDLKRQLASVNTEKPELSRRLDNIEKMVQDLKKQ